MRRKSGSITKIKPLIAGSCIILQETVANTTHILYSAGGVYGFQLPPDPAQAGVQAVLGGDIITVPNQFIKLFLGIHPARIGGQQIEQVKLPPGKVHLLGIDENLVVIHADEDTAP